jgi:hypothetical protein
VFLVGTAVTSEVRDFKQFVARLKAHPDQGAFGVPATAPFRILACIHKLIMSARLNGNICR